jgi:predicted homoserine dehydrogenase-like protein
MKQNNNLTGLRLPLIGLGAVGRGLCTAVGAHPESGVSVVAVATRRLGVFYNESGFDANDERK